MNISPLVLKRLVGGSSVVLTLIIILCRVAVSSDRVAVEGCKNPEFVEQTVFSFVYTCDEGHKIKLFGRMPR